MVKARVRRKTLAALSESHLEELEASGISEELATEAGLFTETDRRRVAALLGRKNGKDWMAPALCFPYHDLSGEPIRFAPEGSSLQLMPYVRLKPGEPQGDKKYLGPVDVPQTIYIPPGVAEYAQDVESDLWLTEGEKKALAGAAEDLVCVGLPGVFGWKKKGQKGTADELGDLLAEFAFEGRRCVICFDSDAMSNNQVMDAAERLSLVLYGEGAEEVLFAVPPESRDGEKVGLDDYIVAGGDVDRLFDSAEVFTKHRNVVEVSAADINPVKTEWLWKNWIPLGELSIFDGAPGQGKTQIMMDIISRLTNGVRMPPEEAADVEPARCVIMPAEDSQSKTLVPRLMAAGVNDLDNVRFALDADGSTLQLPRDIGEVERIVRRNNAKLLLIDPLMAYVDGRLDTHSDASSRQLLRPLMGLAHRTGAAVVAIRHHNKRSGESAVNRGGGSIAFTATARSVFLVGPEPEGEEGSFVFANVKSNLGPPPTSLLYEMVSVDNDYGGSSRIVWKGETNLRANEVVGQAVKSSSAPVSAAARQAVETILLDGPVESSKLYREVNRKTGASEKTIRNICKELECRRGKDGLKKWWVCLPADSFEFEDESSKPKKRRSVKGRRRGKPKAK